MVLASKLGSLPWKSMTCGVKTGQKKKHWIGNKSEDVSIKRDFDIFMQKIPKRFQLSDSICDVFVSWKKWKCVLKCPGKVLEFCHGESVGDMFLSSLMWTAIRPIWCKLNDKYIFNISQVCLKWPLFGGRDKCSLKNGNTSKQAIFRLSSTIKSTQQWRYIVSCQINAPDWITCPSTSWWNIFLKIGEN